MKVFFLLVIFFLTILSLGVNAQFLDEHTETYCNPETNLCTQTIHSTQQRYLLNNSWVDINENWTQEGCLNGYIFCVKDNTNNYEVHVKRTLNSPIAIAIITPDREDYLYYRPDRLEDTLGNTLNLNSDTRAIIRGNELIFNNAFNNADLVLRYLPHKLKEEVRLYSEPFNVVGNLSFITKVSTSIGYGSRRNNTIEFFRGNRLQARIDVPEEQGQGRDMRLRVSGNEVALEVDYQQHNFTRDGVLIIDPSTTLNFNDILRDGFIRQIVKTDGSSAVITYSADNSGSLLNAGIKGCTLDYTRFRIGFDWNVSTVPEGYTITGAKLRLVFVTVDDDSNELGMVGLPFNFRDVPSVVSLSSAYGQMRGNNYGSLQNLIASTDRNLTLTQAGLEGINDSVYGNDIFSYGLSNNETFNLPTCTSGNDTIKTGIIASEHSSSTLRPKLLITYVNLSALEPPKYFNLNVTPASPQVYTGSNTANFTVVFNDTDGDMEGVILSIDGLNFTATNNSQLWNVTIDNTVFSSAGTYSYFWFGNDSFGLSNQTESYNYVLTSVSTGSSWEYAIIYSLVFAVFFTANNLNNRKRLNKKYETQKN